MYEESMTWENAERSCQAEGGHLGNRDVSGGECSRSALQTCFRDGEHTTLAYMGLSDVITRSTFRWSSDNRETTTIGTRLTSGPRCFTESLADGFNLILCTNQRSYICERNLGKWNVARSPSLPQIIIST